MRTRLFSIAMALFLCGGLLTTAVVMVAPSYSADTPIVPADLNAVHMTSDHFALNWYVAGAGGGTIDSPNYQLSSTIGQPVIGRFEGTQFNHRAGFWQEFIEQLFLPIVLRE
jgi:hypothetical protein